jgi:hypothetical protein
LKLRAWNTWTIGDSILYGLFEHTRRKLILSSTSAEMKNPALMLFRRLDMQPALHHILHWLVPNVMTTTASPGLDRLGEYS